MPLARSRSGGLVIAACLLLGPVFALPVAAADSPEAAVDGLFDITASGDFSGLDQVVCAADREAMREAFDFSAQLGLDSDDPTASALTIEVGDRTMELLSQDGDTATVSVQATMTMSVPEDDIEGLVRALLEADLGPDDPPVSDEDLEMMTGLMGGALNQTQTIDEEVTLVREEGEWLVCGGLVETPEESVIGGPEPSVSTEGVCGIVSPEELNALSSLQYDSSSGYAEYCAYSTSDYSDYHTTSVTLNIGQDVEYMAPLYGADQESEVAGARALLGGDDYSSVLFTQVGGDVLQVAVLIDDAPVDIDALGQARLIAELLAPRVPAFREVLTGPEPEPTPEPTPEIPLCVDVTMDVLNELLGLGFDEYSGDASSCQYVSTDGEPGFHFLFAYVNETALDDYRLWLPESDDTTVAGQPAMVTEQQTIIELPGGGRVLDISVSLDGTDDGLAVTAAEVAALLAERIVPGLPVVEATPEEPEASSDVDLEALMAALEDDLAAVEAGSEGGLLEPAFVMCDYVDLDAVNALGVLEYDSASGFFDEICSLSQSDFSDGYSELSMFQDFFSIEDARLAYPDGVDVTVAGLPGFISGSDLRVETSAGPIAFTAILPDAAVEAGMEPADISIPVAELVVAAIEAEAATD